MYNRRLAKNTIFLYLRMIFVLLVSLYSTRAILNALGVVDYGIYNVVAGFVSMFAFLNSSMTNTVQRYFNHEIGKGNVINLNKVYVTSVQIQLLIGIVTLITLELFGSWYINTKMVIPPERIFSAMCVFHLSAASLLLLIFQIPYTASVVAHEHMGFYAVVSMTDAVLKLIIAIILPYISFDKLVSYAVMIFILSFFNFLVFYAYSKSHFEEISYKHGFYKQQFKSMLAFSGWNVCGAFAYTVQGQGLNMLINTFFGPVVNAARGIAYQIQAALSGFSENIAVAFKPQLVESYAKSELSRTKDLMFTMSKFGYIMVFLLSVPISIEVDYILHLWLDGTVPENTSIFVILIMINTALGSLNLPISQTVQAVGNISRYQVIRSLVVMSALPISWFALTRDLPAYMVFVILILVNAINQPISMVLLKRIFTYSFLEYINKVLWPCFLFSILTPILPFVVHCLMVESFSRLIIVVVISILVSIFVAYYVVLNADEKLLLKQLINKLLKNNIR